MSQAGDGKTGTLHGVGADFLGARLLCQLGCFASQLQQALLIHVADYRHHQAVRRIDRKADIHVLLVDQLLAVRRQ